MVLLAKTYNIHFDLLVNKQHFLKVHCLLWRNRTCLVVFNPYFCSCVRCHECPAPSDGLKRPRVSFCNMSSEKQCFCGEEDEVVLLTWCLKVHYVNSKTLLLEGCVVMLMVSASHWAETHTHTHTHLLCLITDPLPPGGRSPSQPDAPEISLWFDKRIQATVNHESKGSRRPVFLNPIPITEH